MKWHWNPMPSIGVPAACKAFTRVSSAVAFAPVYSMLYSFMYSLAVGSAAYAALSAVAT